MARIFDAWKSVIAIIATLASIAVPVWLWQADLNSKSLSIRVLSRIPLQPIDKKSLSGMEVSIDGVRITNPFLAVLEIKNNGRKPITAADFETPLEVRLGYATTFARVRISAIFPKDLEPEIVTGIEKFSLKPILLNPNDTIKITAITSGADPVYSSKTRIIGIPEVSLVNSAKDKANKQEQVLLFVKTLLLLIAASITSASANNWRRVLLRGRASIYISVVCGITGMFYLLELLDEIGKNSFWIYVMSAGALSGVAAIIGAIVNKKLPEPANGTMNKKL